MMGYSLMVAKSKDRVSVMAKKELLYASGTYGIGLWIIKTIFVNRTNPKEARRTISLAIDTLKRENVS